MMMGFAGSVVADPAAQVSSYAVAKALIVHFQTLRCELSAACVVAPTLHSPGF
jgi:hypothetical protein